VLEVSRVKYFVLALPSNERHKCRKKLRMLSFKNSTRIPDPVIDGIRVDFIGYKLMNFFIIVTPMIDGIRENIRAYSTHPHYCSHNNYEGGGTLVVRTYGCDRSSAVTEGCANAEFQQKLHKAYGCEKREEQMMGPVNDDENNLSFNEETRRLMKAGNESLERMRSFIARWDVWYEGNKPLFQDEGCKALVTRFP